LDDSFPIQYGLKEGYALSPLLSIFALEYAIRKVQEILVGLKLNGIHQLPAYADSVNLLGDHFSIINKSTETLINAVKEVGLHNKHGEFQLCIVVLLYECWSVS
jgi:hypothetical protein